MAIWPATVHELTQLQQALGELTPEHWQPPTTVMRIGACFVCFERVHGAGAAGDQGFAGAAVTHRRQLLAGVSVNGPAGGPYRPTLLALREGPLLEQAVRALPITPDVLGAQRHRPRPSPPRRPCPPPRRRAWAAHGWSDHPATGRPGHLASRRPRRHGPAAAGWRGGRLLGPDPAGRSAGGRPCRLADQRPRRGPGGPGRDPSCSNTRASAPRPHAGPDGTGTQPLYELTQVGVRLG